MAQRHAVPSALATGSSPAPHVTSYDLGYEYSLEHWMELRRLVREAHEESEVVHEFADHGILAVA